MNESKLETIEQLTSEFGFYYAFRVLQNHETNWINTPNLTGVLFAAYVDFKVVEKKDKDGKVFYKVYCECIDTGFRFWLSGQALLTFLTDKKTGELTTEGRATILSLGKKASDKKSNSDYSDYMVHVSTGLNR